MAVHFTKDGSVRKYNQHIDQAIRYIILTYVGALVVGACVGDGITGALVGAENVGAMVGPSVGAAVGPQLPQNGPPTSCTGLV